MRKKDYEILAAAIKKHGSDNVHVNNDQRIGAQICADRIARTFAHFAHVDKVAFLAACGVNDVKSQSGAENTQRRQT